jgi:hypothetical protein
MNSNNYILKVVSGGVKLLTINDLKSFEFSCLLLKEFENDNNSNETLQVQITDSQIVIAATRNKWN